jgi:hypothetical protein
MPHLQLPVQRTSAGKPAAEGSGMSPSTVNFMGLPFHAEAGDAAPAVAPSFVFPPLPFADDGAE